MLKKQTTLQEKSDRVADANSLRSLVTGIQKVCQPRFCLVWEAQWVEYEYMISYIYIYNVHILYIYIFIFYLEYDL